MYLCIFGIFILYFVRCTKSEKREFALNQWQQTTTIQSKIYVRPFNEWILAALWAYLHRLWFKFYFCFFSVRFAFHLSFVHLLFFWFYNTFSFRFVRIFPNVSEFSFLNYIWHTYKPYTSIFIPNFVRKTSTKWGKNNVNRNQGYYCRFTVESLS